jgi:hypothetical protein
VGTALEMIMACISASVRDTVIVISDVTDTRPHSIVSRVSSHNRCREAKAERGYASPLDALSLPPVLFASHVRMTYARQDLG